MSLADEATWPKRGTVDAVLFDYDSALKLFLEATSEKLKSPADFVRGPWRSIENAFNSAGYVYPKNNRRRYCPTGINTRCFVYDPDSAKALRHSNNQHKKRPRERKDKEGARTPPNPATKSLNTLLEQYPPHLILSAMQQVQQTLTSPELTNFSVLPQTYGAATKLDDNLDDFNLLPEAFDGEEETAYLVDPNNYNAEINNPINALFNFSSGSEGEEPDFVGTQLNDNGLFDSLPTTYQHLELSSGDDLF